MDSEPPLDLADPGGVGRGEVQLDAGGGPAVASLSPGPCGRTGCQSVPPRPWQDPDGEKLEGASRCPNGRAPAIVFPRGCTTEISTCRRAAAWPRTRAGPACRRRTVRPSTGRATPSGASGRLLTRRPPASHSQPCAGTYGGGPPADRSPLPRPGDVDGAAPDEVGVAESGGYSAVPAEVVRARSPVLRSYGR
jgi:hypothetical protein